MMISLSASSACKIQEPLVKFQKGMMSKMDSSSSLSHQSRKDKVVVIVGATGTGKTKLAIDLAGHFPPGEIVNSDKIQVYKGLEITTNKVTEEEARGVPHHLLGTEDPDSDFTAADFCREATAAVDSIVGRDGLPIIAGGSNSYIDALVNHDVEFRSKYDCCFLWVDVSKQVLHASLRARVDRMMEAGQLAEVRDFFDPLSADYTKGIRKAIGVPEFDRFLRAEAAGADRHVTAGLLQGAIASLKVNNCSLADRQISKIQRYLYATWRRKNMHRLDATPVLLNRGGSDREAWEEHVLGKSLRVVHKFLYGQDYRTHHSNNNHHLLVPARITLISSPPPVAMAATR